MKFLKKLAYSFLAALFLWTATCVPAYAAPGTRVYSIWTYKNVAGAATTTIKSGAGILHGYCVNTVGTTLVLWDNTAASGTKIASITNTALGCFLMDVQFTTGLTAVEVGTGDVTYMFQ